MSQKHTLFPNLKPVSERDAKRVFGQADGYVHFGGHNMRVEQRGERHVVALSMESTSLARKLLVAASAAAGRRDPQLVQDCACDGMSDAVSACMIRTSQLISQMAPEFFEPLRDHVRDSSHRQLLEQHRDDELRDHEPVLHARYHCANAAKVILDGLYRGK